MTEYRRSSRTGVAPQTGAGTSLVHRHCIVTSDILGRQGGPATICSLDLHLSIPVLVEEMGNAIDAAYGTAPERLYLIGVDGRVAYHGGAGPHFFDLDEWERAIAASVSAATV